MPIAKHLVAAAATVLFVGAFSRHLASEPFILDSTASTYPFVFRVEGNLEKGRDTLVIQVRRGLVKSQIPTDLGAEGRVTDITIAFGIGRQGPDGWDFEHETARQSLVSVLEPGGTSEINSATFIITGLDTIPIADRWLVAQLGVQQHLPGVEPGILFSYACAEENLRGATAPSGVRKAGMREKYSTIC